MCLESNDVMKPYYDVALWRSLFDQEDHLISKIFNSRDNKKAFLSHTERQHTSPDSGISWLRIRVTADRSITRSGVRNIIQVSFVFQQN